MVWTARIATLFPQMFPGPLGHSIAGKALEKGLWALETVQIRDYALDKHKTVDDTPYGGGTGMVLRPDVVHAALCAGLEPFNDPAAGQSAADLFTPVQVPSRAPAVIYFSPRGVPLTQRLVREHVRCHPAGALLLCGRYEGVDQRVLDYWREHHGLIEVSIGDYILSGGEMAALVYLDAVVRMLPGVLPKTEAVEIESFSEGMLEFSHYTKPQVWNGMEVPEILMSGHHGRIEAWRREESLRITRERRPDLLPGSDPDLQG